MSEQLSHRAACHHVATYMMRTLAWCDLAAVEVSGRVTGTPPARPDHTEHPFGTLPWKEYQRAKRAWEDGPESGGGQLDVLALTLPGWKPRRRLKPRVAIVEVKVSRGDLLSDLREGKLRKYEPQATHVYLAATDEALLWHRAIQDGPAHAPGTVLRNLRERGLPDLWGVIRLGPGERPEKGWWPHRPLMLRQPRKYAHACVPTDELIARLAMRSAVSMAWRGF